MKFVFTADANNAPHLLEDKHLPFHLVPCHFSKSLLVRVGSSVFIVVFKIFKDSWIIAVDSFC
jgi:hypothetical protein